MAIDVLHITHGTNTGLAHCVADYVSAQVAAGMNVTVACPGGRLGELAAQRGATVLEWRASRNPGAATALELRTLRKLVQKVNPHLVHLHCAKAGLIGRLALRGSIPTVFSPHGWSFLAVDGMAKRLVREWERFAARWTTVTVCVGQGEATTGRGSGIQGRYEVYPNQINVPELAKIREQDRGTVRKSLGLSVGQPLAVLAARICRQKGQDIAVQAWPWVREAVPTAQLALLGDGPMRAELEEKLTAADEESGVIPDTGVRFLGQTDRETTLRWMYAADVVVCPSRWEGMSLVPLEALALGRPVVAADVDGMREAIPVQAGTLVAAERPEEFAAAVAALLADPAVAMTMGDEARAQALRNEAKKVTPPAERLAALYAELLKPAPAQP